MKVFLLILSCMCSSGRAWDNGIRKEKVEYGWYYPYARYELTRFKAKSKSVGCTFRGYTPTGDILDAAGNVVAPKAVLAAKFAMNDVQSGAEQHLGKATAVVMHASKLSKAVSAAAPALAPVLGIVSAVFGFIFKKPPGPTAKDILKGTNLAIAELTKHLNKKIDQMKDYVNEKVLLEQRKLIERHFTAEWRAWERCITKSNEAETIACQVTVADALITRQSLYVLEKEWLMKKPELPPLDYEKVRWLESYLLIFRGYANLLILELTPIIEYYCVMRKNLPNAAKECNKYTEDMKKAADLFIKYATKAIKYIKNGHYQSVERCLSSVQLEENDGIKCDVIGLGNKKSSCEVKYTKEQLRDSTFDGDWEDACYTACQHRPWECRSCMAKSMARYNWMAHDVVYYSKWQMVTIVREYQQKNKAAIQKYWEQELLDFVPNWKKAIDTAYCMSTLNPYTELKDDPWSDKSRPRFRNDFEVTTDEDFTDKETTQVVPGIEDYEVPDVFTNSLQSGYAYTTRDDYKQDEQRGESAVTPIYSSETSGHVGKWGVKQRCPSGEYVYGFQLKSEADQGSDDDTALNGIKLLCNGGGSVTSKTEKWGEWLTSTQCRGKEPVTGFQIQIEGAQGSGDDTAANNVNLWCKGGYYIKGNTNTHIGSWSTLLTCPTGQVVVGIQTRVEESCDCDDTALNGVKLLCGDHIQAPKESNVYILDKFIHGDDKDCRKYCNGTGLCQKFCLKKSRCHWDCDFLPCGPNGYCCTLGDTGCPAEMASFAPANSYRCMAYKKTSTTAKPNQNKRETIEKRSAEESSTPP